MPLLANAQIPEATSARPSKRDWVDAQRVALARALPQGCDSHLLREWLRLRCRDLDLMTISLLSGTSRSTAFWVSPSHDEHGKSSDYAEVIVGLKRGDRRLIQVTAFKRADLRSKTNADQQELAFIISESWTGSGGPVVTVH